MCLDRDDEFSAAVPRKRETDYVLQSTPYEGLALLPMYIGIIGSLIRAIALVHIHISSVNAYPTPGIMSNEQLSDLVRYSACDVGHPATARESHQAKQWLTNPDL